MTCRWFLAMLPDGLVHSTQIKVHNRRFLVVNELDKTGVELESNFQILIKSFNIN